MPGKAIWALTLLLVTSVHVAGAQSSSAQPTVSHRPLLAPHAAHVASQQQHIKHSRKLLKGGEEDYAHATGASRWMYRLIAGTWLEFESRAGYPGDTSSEQICAKAKMANACSKRQADKLGLRDWPSDSDSSSPTSAAVTDMRDARTELEKTMQMQTTQMQAAATAVGDVAPRG